MTKPTETGSNKAVQETGRWLRIGIFGLTVLGPAINTIVARKQKQATDSRAIEKTLETKPVVSKEQRGMTRPAWSGSLQELKEQPYAQDLLKRGEQLAEDLRERSGKLSQVLLEQSGNLTHDLAERSNAIAHDLIERSSKASQELLKLSEKASKELTRRSEEAAKELSVRSEKAAKELTARSEKAASQLASPRKALVEEENRWRPLVGFGIGLLAAAIAAYLLIQKRLRQQQQEEEEKQHIVLPTSTYTENTAAQQGQSRTGEMPSTSKLTTTAPQVVAVAEPPVVPKNAKLIGVISTKRYYPIETPLSQLTSPEKMEQDIKYFSTEEEAKAQGFLAARQ